MYQVKHPTKYSKLLKRACNISNGWPTLDHLHAMHGVWAAFNA